MAKQVEGIGVGLTRLFRQHIKVDTALAERRYDLAALVCIGPTLAEVSRCRRNRANAFSGVFRIFDDTKLLPLRVQFMDQMGYDLDLAAVEIEFARLAGRRFDSGSPPIHHRASETRERRRVRCGLFAWCR
jgi:hypothetical protein